ncbi:MAG TPA: glycosyltransferase [Candidatus Aminicenantes bacterium]|nr:glycosyltransferase [Candidatus Aminicenantes bacterium]
MDELVAFVVVNYNGAAVIGACIESILRQRHGNQRIFVVDNHSGDQSAAGLVGKYPGVEVVFLEKNHGYAKANNIGIDLALRQHPAFIALVNNDVVLHENWLDSLLRFAEGQRYDCVQSVITHYESDRVVDSLGIAVSPQLHIYDRGHGLALEEDGASGPIFGPCFAAALFRAEMVRRLSVTGRFLDERLVSFYEDVDCCFRANLAGCRAGLLYQPLCRHRRSFTADRIPQDKYYYIGRNYFYVLGTYFPGRVILKYAWRIAWQRGALWARTVRHPASCLAFFCGTLAGVVAIPGRRSAARRSQRGAGESAERVWQRIRAGHYG